jgi:hypothetical protein
MNKAFYLLILVGILSSSTLVSADAYNTSRGLVYTGMVHLGAAFVNQNPSPANPGEYVDILFKIENRGTNISPNTTVELIPEYPFSLNPGVSSVQNLGTVNALQIGNDAFLVRYKLRVDDDAVNGDNEIKLKYFEGDGSVFNLATFNVSVSNSRTDFDVIAQDSTTLAIANTGNNTASAVIVRIPQQQNFRVNGTSATIIGNLNAGDYTLTTFQIASVRSSNSSIESNLTVEISYTDTLGIRRTVQNSIPFEFGSSGFGNVTGGFTQRGQTAMSNGLWYIVIGVVGIVIVVAFIKFRTRKKK